MKTNNNIALDVIARMIHARLEKEYFTKDTKKLKELEQEREILNRAHSLILLEKTAINNTLETTLNTIDDIRMLLANDIANASYINESINDRVNIQELRNKETTLKQARNIILSMWKELS